MSKRLYKNALNSASTEKMAYLELLKMPPGEKSAAKPKLAPLAAPSRNIREIIEQSASKDEGAWETARDSWYKSYMEGEVSEKDVDSLIARLPGKHLKIGSFATNEASMNSEIEKLNREGKASIFLDSVDFMMLEKFHGRYYLHSAKDEGFYWVNKEDGNYSIYPPNSKTDYELVLRTIYMLGLPISHKMQKEINELDQKIASALVDALSYMSMTGGGKSLLLKAYATANDINEHLKYNSMRQITSFFVERAFEGLIPKRALAYAEKIEYS